MPCTVSSSSSAQVPWPARPGSAWPAPAQAPWPAQTQWPGQPAPPWPPTQPQPLGQTQWPGQTPLPGQRAAPWAGQAQANWAAPAQPTAPVSPGPESAGAESDEPSDGSAKKRHRVLIGGAATVGIVALIAIGNAPDGDVVVARCVDDRNVVVDESGCPDPDRASSSNGSGGYGEVASGGSNVMPKKVSIVTLSGRTLVERGGFGGTATHRSSGG